MTLTRRVVIFPSDVGANICVSDLSMRVLSLCVLWERMNHYQQEITVGHDFTMAL